MKAVRKGSFFNLVMKKYILFLLLCLLLSSCTNEYERGMIGSYSIKSYKDTFGDFNDRGYELKLNDDNSFEFGNGNEKSKISGKWKAYDDGDYTLIEFTFSDKNTSQGFIGNYKSESAEFEIGNGADGFDKGLKDLSFIKISK